MRIKTGRWLPVVAAFMVFAGIGAYLLQSGKAATLSVGQEAEDGALAGNAAPVISGGVTAVGFGTNNGGGGTRAAGLLAPYSMGFAPYAYIPYGDVAMASFGSAANVKNFFAAFILGSGCTPLWDGSSSLGLASSRSTTIASDIASVRAQGGDVALSFGGASGTELANACTNASQLQTAYQSVIDKFSLTHINFDLELKNETDAASMTRRTQAVKALQQANPNLKVSLTLPVEPTGLDSDGLNVVQKFHDAGITLASVDIMAMDFGNLSGAQSPRITSAATGTVNQLKQIYSSATTAQLWKALGIIVLIGQNDDSEIFQLTDAQVVHDFAVQNGVGTLSIWSANRDAPCSGGASLGNDNCSGVSQAKYQFSNTLAIPAKP